MKKNKIQPARKSYFFGQGYQDVIAAIKLSWCKNAEKAITYYDRYNEYGLMTLRGFYNLFCALSVVSFGTVFFVAISIIMFLLVSFFFALVYLGFSIVWLLDRVYLVRKRIFTACNECKYKSLIPTYLCPNCGAQHTNLTPGSYGILKRTCNCGKKLPTTFFNGRKKLQAICPNCMANGKMTYLNDRESRPICVPVVGARSVGKTAYITAFSKKFVEFVAPQNNLKIEFYNGAKEIIYSDMKSHYAHGTTEMTKPSNINEPSAISFSFFVKHEELKPERLVHIYDIAGEVFTEDEENEVQRQYEYCHGIIFMIDPFAIPSVRAKYESLLPPEDVASIGKADINGTINVFINKLRQVTGLSDSQMSDIPIAIVLAKVDSEGLRDEFSDEKIEEIEYRYRDLNIQRNDAVDYLCRKFLEENEMKSFLQVIQMRFKIHRFFSVSAIGHTKGTGAYNPIRVLEPMEWICSRNDKKFASLWVKRKYSEKPVATIIEKSEG